MLFPPEHAQWVKAWIVKRLENTSDADADVLADYVMALMDHDGDVESVRKLCLAEIPDFLKEDSTVFVDDVFRAIHHQSYLPGAPPPPPAQKQPATAQAPQGPQGLQLPGPLAFGLPYDDVPMAQAAPLGDTRNGSRKRAFHDRGDTERRDAPNGSDPRFPGARPLKQARRRGNRKGDMHDLRQPQLPGFPGAGYHPSQNPSGMSQFDMNKAMESILGMNLDFMGQASQMAPPPRGRPRCRDYDTKGYCSRGSTCMFEHGNESIYLTPPQPVQSGTYPPLAQPPAGDEYDPNNAAVMMGGFRGSNHAPGRQPYQGRQMGGRQGNSPRKKRKAPFSADGPVYDRKKSTIVVENIPEENFSEDDVRGFFSQFGNILEVSMQPYKRLAIVKYDTWASASAAFASPKVVFENRFVKVFWYKDGESSQATNMSISADEANGHKNGSTKPEDGGASSQESEINLEELQRRQEEAQKAFEEKTSKMQEVERQRKELEQRQKELFQKRQEEIARLNSKLALSARKNSQGEEGGDAATPSKPPTQTEALRAQLAALEEEAKLLGIDPNASDDFSQSSSPWTPGGGARGRGHGGYFRSRGRAPRGARGGYRGPGSNDAAYAAYSLDNRPKKIMVSGVDFTVAEKDELLRQFLFGIGEFTDIQTAPAATEITFKDRKTAEKFMYSLHNKELPGVDGPVDLAWIGANGTLTAPSTPASSTRGFGFGSGTSNNNSSSNNNNNHNNDHTPGASGGDFAQNQPRQHKQTAPVTRGAAEPHTAEEGTADADLAAAGSVSDKDVSIVLEHPGEPPEHAEMDYDVADDNQWDM